MFWRFTCASVALVLGVSSAHAVDATPSLEKSDANPRLTGTPFMQVWHAEDYGASPVNWRVIQHPTSGLIYVGNNFGVLEFDGARWRSILLPREGAARSLTIDRHGVIWAAGIGDICQLQPDASGQLRAVDMTERIPVADRVFGVVNRAVATRDGVYIAGQRRIFLFREDGSVRVWRTEGNFSPIWEIGDAVHVGRDRGELVRLQPDGGAKMLFSSDKADEPLLRTYSATREGNAWILLTRFGPARWDGEASTAPLLAPESTPLFTAEPARTTLQLADGRFAFGSVHGAMILSHTGQFEQRLDVTHGLPVDTINGFAEDREGGLWIAMQNGIARVQLDSPFALHGLPQGLDGGPRRMSRFADRLYLAHGGGVSWRNPTDGQFQLVHSIRGGANRPVAIDGHLLVTTGTALRDVRPDDSSVSIAAQNFLPLIESRRQPGTLFSGDADSLWIFSPTPGQKTAWRLEGRVKNLNTGVVQIYDTNDGFVWAVGDNASIWRVDFRRGIRVDAPAEQFDTERGVPPARRRDHTQMFFLGNELFAVSTAWFLRYDAAHERFVPAPTNLGVTSNVDAIENDGPLSVWLHTRQPSSQIVHLTATPRGEGEVPSVAARIFPAAPVEGLIFNSVFFESATHTLWLAGQGSLVSLDLDWQSRLTRPPAPAVSVRKISTAAGATLLGGAEAQRPGGLQLKPDQNALRIEFAAPTFKPNYLGAVHTRYRTRVDGLEDDWTRWSDEAFRDFTNLPYRDLVFHVQAQTGDDQLTEPVTLAIMIAPPWWFTRWALGGYLLAGVGLISGLVVLRTRALRARALQLEGIIAARTTELAEKNSTLATQNTELAQLRQLETKEKIAARLGEEKARLEVLRYQLNPHFLFNAFTSICSQLPPSLGPARATIERLTDFCRFTLFRPAGDENPTLDEEMKMLSAYLDIEKSRWGELLHIEISVARDAASERLPPFLLLPLVENALKYGGATSRDGLKLRIVAWRDGGGLFIEVANTGEWVAPSPNGRSAVPSLGIGHENLRQRLQRFYPDAHVFTTEASDGWVRARLRLSAPQREPAVVPSSRSSA